MKVIMATRKKKSEPEPEGPRVRMIFDTHPLMRKAIKHRASKESVRRRRPVSATELLNELLREMLKEEISEMEGNS